MGVVRKRGTRLRVCVDCGKSEQVRQDNTGQRCRVCAPKAGARTNMANGLYSRLRPPTKKAKPESRMTLTCGGCRGVFTRFVSNVVAPENSFCSRACVSAAKSVERVCKGCGSRFKTQIGRLSDRTNSSANFCSRPCYERWLCRTDRVNGRGSRWCGTCRADSLQVHHIVPYRLTRDNRHSNLIPLCRRCHKVVELLTVEVEALGLSPESIARVAGLQLRARQAMTGSILSHVAHAA